MIMRYGATHLNGKKRDGKNRAIDACQSKTQFNEAVSEGNPSISWNYRGRNSPQGSRTS